MLLVGPRPRVSVRVRGGPAAAARLFVLAPRLVLRPLHLAVAAAPPSSSSGSARDPRQPVQAPFALREIRREHTLARLLARATRVEAATRPQPAAPRRGAARHPAPGPAAPPVERVLRRPVPAQRDDAPAQPSVPTALPAAPALRAAPVAPATARQLPGGLDVGRLADEVIETIDRRVLARRERLGRV